MYFLLATSFFFFSWSYSLKIKTTIFKPNVYIIDQNKFKRELILKKLKKKKKKKKYTKNKTHTHIYIYIYIYIYIVKQVRWYGRLEKKKITLLLCQFSHFKIKLLVIII